MILGRGQLCRAVGGNRCGEMGCDQEEAEENSGDRGGVRDTAEPMIGMNTASEPHESGKLLSLSALPLSYPSVSRGGWNRTNGHSLMGERVCRLVAWGAACPQCSQEGSGGVRR